MKKKKMKKFLNVIKIHLRSLSGFWKETKIGIDLTNQRIAVGEGEQERNKGESESG